VVKIYVLFLSRSFNSCLLISRRADRAPATVSLCVSRKNVGCCDHYYSERVLFKRQGHTVLVYMEVARTRKTTYSTDSMDMISENNK